MSEPRITVRVEREAARVEAVWRRLEGSAVTSVYQRYDWVARWCAHVAGSLEVDPRFCVIEEDDEPVGLLPLGFHRIGPVGVLTNLSDSHTNFVGGLFLPDFAHRADEAAMAGVRDALFAANRDAEGISLCCLPEAWQGTPNPLRHWCSNDSAHDAWACDLSDGFDALLDRGNGKRKRKKHRQAARKFEDAGGWRVARPQTPAQSDAMFAQACTHMAARFEASGIRDPFAASPVQAFMRDALAGSLGTTQPVMAIWALEVGGEPVAWQAGGTNGDTLSLMFTVYHPERYANLGPGDFLLYETLRAAAESGIQQLDLGRGAEPYKLSWCDRRIPLLDIRIGRTTKANIILAAHRQATALKRKVREDERLWSIAKRMRRIAA